MSVIVDDLISAISSDLLIRGHRGLRFLHEVNDFPCFYLHAGSERFVHIGAGQRLAVISADIRIYNYGDDIETLLRRIETCVQNYFDPRVDEFRVTEVSTDEGLMAPYQIADLKLEILYRKLK